MLIGNNLAKLLKIFYMLFHKKFGTLSLYVWCGHCGGNKIAALLKMQKAQWLSWNHCLIGIVLGVLKLAISFLDIKESLYFYAWFFFLTLLLYFVFTIVCMSILLLNKIPLLMKKRSKQERYFRCLWEYCWGALDVLWSYFIFHNLFLWLLSLF